MIGATLLSGLLVLGIGILAVLRARDLSVHPERYEDPSDHGPGGW